MVETSARRDDGSAAGYSTGTSTGTSTATSRGRNRTLTNALCLAGVVTATFAWSSMIYLRTWGDPGTGPRIAAAVLDDPAARAEIAEPLTSYVTSIVGPANRPLVAGIVDEALSDPRSLGAVAERFSPLSSLGGLDVGGFSSLLDERLVDLDAQLGSELGSQALQLPELRLPEVASLSNARSTVSALSRWAALVAISAFAAAFVLGDRRRVARRYGMWAIGTSGAMLIAPYVVTAGASRWARSMDATIHIVVDAYMDPVRWMIVALAASGVTVWAAPYVLSIMAAGSRFGSWVGAPPRRAEGVLASPRTDRVPVTPRRHRAGTTGDGSLADTYQTDIDDHRFDASGWEPTTVVTKTPAPTSSTPAAFDDIDVWAAYGPRASDGS